MSLIRKIYPGRVELIIYLALILLVASIRFWGLAKFVTVDEPAWLIKSANFYYALGQRDFEKTVYDYKPAVTTMWITTAAILSYFPDFRGQGQGYLTKNSQFNDFLLSFGKQPLELLRRSRLITLSINTLLLLLSFFLLRIYLGDRLALTATLFISLDPYFMGHSRLLNHEALMCLLLLVSILAMLVYLHSSRKNIFLVMSGASAGLALLTKSSATIVIPFVGLMILDRLIKQWLEQRKFPGAFPNHIKTFLIWLATLILVYVLVWPGMWVNPVKMLTEVYGNAFSYAFQGAGLSITQDLNPEEFSLETTGILPYTIALLWGTTPVVWLGFILAVIGLFNHKTRLKARLLNPEMKRAILYFGLLAILFILLFGIARGRNSAHYILASYLSVDILAGVALAASVQVVTTKSGFFSKKWAQNAILFGVLLIQGISAYSQYPYYYTYTNPIMAWVSKDNANPNVGYGEGLELAGQYLSQKREADEMTVMSWYSIGPFSYFFEGKVIPLLSTDQAGREAIKGLKNSDYLVIYTVNQKRRNIPANLLQALEGIPPESTLWVNGVEYIRIYEVDAFPDTVFALLD